MANHKSSVKRIRQTVKKRLTNKMNSSRMRTAVKKLRLAIDENNKELATELLPKTQALIAKLAKSSAMTKATASRRISRLASQVARLGK